jgi:hypothetical protein
MATCADASKPPNRSRSARARFVANRGNDGTDRVEKNAIAVESQVEWTLGGKSLYLYFRDRDGDL